MTDLSQLKAQAIKDLEECKKSDSGSWFVSEALPASAHAVLELVERVERLERALEKCMEQRNDITQNFVEGTESNPEYHPKMYMRRVNAWDEELDAILKRGEK